MPSLEPLLYNWLCGGPEASVSSSPREVTEPPKSDNDMHKKLHLKALEKLALIYTSQSHMHTPFPVPKCL